MLLVYGSAESLLFIKGQNLFLCIKAWECICWEKQDPIWQHNANMARGHNHCRSHLAYPYKAFGLADIFKCNSAGHILTSSRSLTYFTVWFLSLFCLRSLGTYYRYIKQNNSNCIPLTIWRYRNKIKCLKQNAVTR